MRALRDRLTKVALKQKQHENQSEERIKARRKCHPRRSSFSGTLASRGKNKNRVPMAPTQCQTAGEVQGLPRPKAKIPSVNSSRNWGGSVCR